VIWQREQTPPRTLVLKIADSVRTKAADLRGAPGVLRFTNKAGSCGYAPKRDRGRGSV